MGAALSDCRNESGCMPGAPARSWESTTVPSENNSSQLPEETLIQFVDEKRGLPYYYDLKTGETTWETPDQFLVHPSVVEWMEGAYEGTSPIARATRHASEFRMVQPPVNEPQQRDTSVPVKQSGVRIAVLCTKEEDAKPLRKMMRDACEQMLKGCVRRTRGKIHGKLVDLVITGKGKVNASCAVVALCYESTPNSHLAAILSLGRTAANAKEVGEADVIVCSGVMTEDSESSRKESSELKIEADSKLLACTRKKIGDVSLRICEGPVDESWITLMCPKKHTMCKVRGLPKAYVGKHSGVFCDQCELTGLENLDPFWHCAECGWDYCSKCSEEKDVNRIVRSPLSWSVEQDQRVDLRQERFSFVVSEDKEVSAMATVAKKFQVPFLAIQEVMEGDGDDGSQDCETKSSTMETASPDTVENIMPNEDPESKEDVIGSTDESKERETSRGLKRAPGAAAIMAAQVISEFEPA